MEMHDILTTVSGTPITVKDVATYLKSNGTFRNAIYSLIEIRVIALKCQEYKVKISDHEFYEHAETKRRLLGLPSAADINRYCKWHGIVMEQWNDTVRQEILRRKLKEKVIKKAEIESYFALHESEFSSAYLSRIVLGGRIEAAAVKDRILEGTEDFAILARRVSVERNTRIAGGYLGLMKRGSLPPTVGQAVFAAKPGQIIGPFEQSEYWVIYRIEDIQPAKLDDTSRASVADHLFGKWLERDVFSAKP